MFKQPVKFLAILLFLLPNTLIAQTMTEKFCHVQIFSTNRNFKVKVNYGSQLLPVFKDSSIVSELEKLTKLTNEVDILNSIAKSGWVLMGLTAMSHSTYDERDFYFKREFGSVELTNQMN